MNFKLSFLITLAGVTTAFYFMNLTLQGIRFTPSVVLGSVFCFGFSFAAIRFIYKD